MAVMYDGSMWGHSWGWAGWVFFCVVAVVFWAAVITALIFAIRYAGGSHDAAGGPPPQALPEDVLAQRFARGEIDEDEYRRRVTVLHEHR